MESCYNDTGRDPDTDTGGRWFGSLIFIEKQGASKRGRGQAKVHKPGESPKGMGRQAGSRSGQTEWSGRQVQSPGRERVRTRRSRKTDEENMSTEKHAG
jgi:hypothetical protein